MVPPKLFGIVKPIVERGLTAATPQTVNVQGVILLHAHVQLEDVRVGVWFGVVTGLDVSVLVGTKFIDTFVAGISPPERKVDLQKFIPVNIIPKDPPTQRVMTMHDKRRQAD